MHNVHAPAGAMKGRVTEGTENESAENVTEWPRRESLVRSLRQGRIIGFESSEDLGEGRQTIQEQNLLKFNVGAIMK